MKLWAALGLIVLVSPMSAGAQKHPPLSHYVGSIVESADVQSRGYSVQMCSSLKSLVEASVERYKDPECGGVGPYRAECDNVVYLQKKTGADVYVASHVNRSVGSYLMNGGDTSVMPDLVYKACTKRIGESNTTTLK